MHNPFRFLYLNAYAFLLLFCGTIAALLPLCKVSKWLIVPQIFAVLACLKQAVQLFSTWNDKKIKYEILMGKNRKEFRPETFKIFMQAPCGRLLAKVVLKDLGIPEQYKMLTAYKEPFFISMKKNCAKQETKIYINEDVL